MHSMMEGSEGNGKALSPQRFSLSSSKIWFCSLMPQNGLQDFLPWVNPSNKHGLQDFISLGLPIKAAYRGMHTHTLTLCNELSTSLPFVASCFWQFLRFLLLCLQETLSTPEEESVQPERTNHHVYLRTMRTRCEKANGGPGLFHSIINQWPESWLTEVCHCQVFQSASGKMEKQRPSVKGDSCQCNRLST
jgi:hypothetical protein